MVSGAPKHPLSQGLSVRAILAPCIESQKTQPIPQRGALSHPFMQVMQVVDTLAATDFAGEAGVFVIHHEEFEAAIPLPHENVPGRQVEVADAFVMHRAQRTGQGLRHVAADPALGEPVIDARRVGDQLGDEQGRTRRAA